MDVRTIRFSPSDGGRGQSLNKFGIRWQGNLDAWGCTAKQPTVPISVTCAAVEEALTRDMGRAFLLPSVSRALGKELTLDQIGPEVIVLKFQEGSDSGIFKVTVEVTSAPRERRQVSFCINAAKGAQLNQLHRDIFGNLVKLRKIDPRYVVKPYFYTTGAVPYQGDETKLAVFSVEWLEGYTEIDAVNMAERFDGGHPDMGFAPLGLRHFVLNDASLGSFDVALIKYPELEAAIGEEMLKILFLYFDVETATGIHDFGINNGDFVYKANPDGSFNLKLVSVRKYAPFPAISEPGKSHFNVAGFVQRLLYVRESSVTHQDPADQYYETLAIYSFTPTDICRGIRKVLIEKYGLQGYKLILLKLLGAILMIDSLSVRMGGLSKERCFRSVMVQQEIQRFIAEEERPDSGAIEI